MSTYVPIASQTLTSTATEIVFSSIPQNYTDLILVCNVQVSSATDDLNIQFNGDTSSSGYSHTQLFSNGSSTYSTRNSNSNKFRIADYMPDSTFSGVVITSIMNYSNGTTYKTAISRWGEGYNATGANVGLWRNTSPITSIRLTEGSGLSFKVNSTFTLYGVAVGNSSAKATGGNIVVTDGSYWYHAFTSSGAFIPNEALSADLLIVAGGGAGGWSLGGGGGAGGVRQLTSQSLTAQLYPVIVGAGGAILPATPSGSGTNSVFGTISATGGGGGDRVDLPNSAGANGGSGGGGAGAGNGGGTNSAGGSGNAGGYTPVEGYAGRAGDGYTSGMWISGGGGGAGAASNSKNGGAGVTSSLINTISTAIKIGQLSGGNYYFAGGGGGGTLGSGGGTGGSGGVGGGQEGNSGSYTMTGTKALVNTGSGGGGGWTADNKGAGASGIVVVRYAV